MKKNGRRTIQGKIYGELGTSVCRPFADLFTVTLYPIKKGPRVKYLKFMTKEEYEKWEIEPGMRILCEGCSHEVDGKELIFDISDVQRL